MGAEIEIDHGYVDARADRLHGAEIAFPHKTVTGTENLMMAAALAEGTTVLRNAAQEPEIIDLADLLNAMGAAVRGAGTDVIEIELSDGGTLDVKRPVYNGKAFCHVTFPADRCAIASVRANTFPAASGSGATRSAHTFSAGDADDRQSCREVVKVRRKNKSMEDSIGSDTDSSSNDKVFNVDFIDEEDFKLRANTRDLLLFRTNNFISSIQRGILRSEFDHVAMIVKNLGGVEDDETIYVLEALGNTGVRITDWDTCRQNLGDLNVFDRIVYRHVKFNRSQEASDQLYQFILEAQDCKYQISAKKLLLRTSAKSDPRT